MLKNEMLKTVSAIRLATAVSIVSISTGLFASSAALAGTNCTLGVCGIVDSYLSWPLLVARDSQSHWSCKDPYKGPVAMLPPFGVSNRAPLYWRDTDCYRKGNQWIRIWTYTPVLI